MITPELLVRASWTQSTELAFVVRLAEHDFETELLGALSHGLLNVGK
jgi:hypothetical protein